MERRSKSQFQTSRPTIYLKRGSLLKFKGKTLDEVKAQLRLIAELQKAASDA